jgi:hypothetical protein
MPQRQKEQGIHISANANQQTNKQINPKPSGKYP